MGQIQAEVLIQERINPFPYDAAPSYTPLLFCCSYACRDDRIRQTMGLRFLLSNSYCDPCNTRQYFPHRKLFTVVTWGLKLSYLSMPHIPSSLCSFSSCCFLIGASLLSLFLSVPFLLSTSPSRPAPLAPQMCAQEERLPQEGSCWLPGRQAG